MHKFRGCFIKKVKRGRYIMWCIIKNYFMGYKIEKRNRLNRGGAKNVKLYSRAKKFIRFLQ